MDANGTRFHHFLGQRDWKTLVEQSNAAAEEDVLDWNAASATVMLHELVFRFPNSPGAARPSIADRRGAACDRYGNWYWIAADGMEIRALGSGEREAGHFWSVADLEDCDPPPSDGAFAPTASPQAPNELPLRGLTVTDHHYLVVGVLDPPGLLVFDLHAGGPPLQLGWPVPFAPFDMAPAPGGGVWILDLPSDGSGPRYWALDRHFRVIMEDQSTAQLSEDLPDDFQPRDGGPTRFSPGRRFPEGITLEMASPLALLHPVAIESLPDGSVLILESDPALPYSVIYRYRFAMLVNEPLSLETALEGMLTEEAVAEQPHPYALQGYDFAFVPTGEEGDVRGNLYIVASDGNQSFRFGFSNDTSPDSFIPAPTYLPMRRFSGKALVACDDAVYYDLQEQWLPLVPQPRRRFRSQAVLILPPRDGKQADVVWHRLLLDAIIPPGTNVSVESRAANQETLITQMPWQPETSLYRRSLGSEIANHRPFNKQEQKCEGAGTWELLFQEATGRFLQVRLTIQGNGRQTPRLRALRLYYRRFSYQQSYLPAAYGYDHSSADFLDRFLANFEGIFTTLEDRIAAIQWVFDVDATQAEYLEWLAGWLGATLDPAWEESRRRLFLRHALTIFGQRGTLPGVIRTVRLATDPQPDDSLFEEDVLPWSGSRGQGPAQTVCQPVRVIEHFNTRNVSPAVYGDPTAEVPRVIAADTWSPAEGAPALHDRYRLYLSHNYTLPQTGGTVALDLSALNEAWNTNFTAEDAVQFSPIVPSEPARAADWRGFVATELGFTYAEVTEIDTPFYRHFLARHYRQISALNTAYGLDSEQAYDTFENIALPGEDDFPEQPARLNDWVQFASLALPIRRSAHRFTILVAADPGSTPAAAQEKLAYVRRLVEIVRPSHTAFDVRSYLALFQVGSARVELDTLLGEGSRFVALLLGSAYLGESYLRGTHPWNVRDRTVVGRDALGSLR